MLLIRHKNGKELDSQNEYKWVQTTSQNKTVLFLLSFFPYLAFSYFLLSILISLLKLLILRRSHLKPKNMIHKMVEISIQLTFE